MIANRLVFICLSLFRPALFNGSRVPRTRRGRNGKPIRMVQVPRNNNRGSVICDLGTRQRNSCRGDPPQAPPISPGRWIKPSLQLIGYFVDAGLDARLVLFAAWVA